MDAGFVPGAAVLGQAAVRVADRVVTRHGYEVLMRGTGTGVALQTVTTAVSVESQPATAPAVRSPAMTYHLSGALTPAAPTLSVGAWNLQMTSRCRSAASHRATR